MFSWVAVLLIGVGIARLLCLEGGEGGSGGSGAGSGSGGSGGEGGSGAGGSGSGGSGSGGSGSTQNQQGMFGADYVKQLRDEAAESRIKARDAETRATTAESRVTELEGKFKALATDAALTSAMGSAGIKEGHQDAVRKLIDVSKLDIDNDGKPNADKLKAEIEDVKKKYPGLFGASSRNIDAGEKGKSTDTSPNQAMNDRIRAAAGIQV